MVEDDHRCGGEGYPLKFGYRLCQKYLNAEKELSVSVQKWFPKIRYCLQDYLERNRGSIRDCNDLHRKAINSHIPCYKKTGFCELSFKNRLEILEVTSTDILNMDVIAMSFQIDQECRK